MKVLYGTYFRDRAMSHMKQDGLEKLIEFYGKEEDYREWRIHNSEQKELVNPPLAYIKTCLHLEVEELLAAVISKEMDIVVCTARTTADEYGMPQENGSIYFGIEAQVPWKSDEKNEGLTEDFVNAVFKRFIGIVLDGEVAMEMHVVY